MPSDLPGTTLRMFCLLTFMSVHLTGGWTAAFLWARTPTRQRP